LALTIPTDLAYHLRDALRWYPNSKPAQQFRELVAADVPWDADPVRELIRWAHRRKIAVEGVRFLIATLAGFRGPGQVQRFRRAREELRRAVEAVASGAESELAYADGRDLLALPDPSPPPMRGDDIEQMPLVFPSLGPPAPAEAIAPPATATPTRPLLSGGRPSVGWHTR
jgi:hypothetical protein